VLASDPDDPGGSQRKVMAAAAAAQIVTMKFGREDELQSDELGVRYMAEAGYDPRSMVGVMKILAEAGGGGGRGPDWTSSHPNPERRIDDIQKAIDELFPDGVPPGLVP
jgi:beta-barrel assembly-enhancing protease